MGDYSLKLSISVAARLATQYVFVVAPRLAIAAVFLFSILAANSAKAGDVSKITSRKVTPVDIISIASNYYDWGADMLARANSSGQTISGWQIRPLISSMLEMYRYSGDAAWLEKAAHLSKTVLSFRGDKTGLLSYDGKKKPQWYRDIKTSVFYISPYFEYPLEKRDNIMSDRGWKNLHFSDINHDGLFLSALLETVIELRSAALHPDLQERLINASSETIASHEGQWNISGEGSGYYIFEKGSPIFMDGFEFPVNEAAPFGEALVKLYKLTGDRSALTRAHAMMSHWLNNITYRDGLPTYPYVLGAWHRGWSPDDNISVNTPSAKPNTSQEVFHKAALTISFARQLDVVVDDARLHRFVSALPNIMARAADISWNGISFFPLHLDLSQPSATVYTTNPAGFWGWSSVSGQRAQDLMYLHSAVDQKKGGIYNAALLELAPHRDNFSAVETIEFDVTPYLIEDAPERCLFDVEQDSIVDIRFRSETTMNSRLLIKPHPGFGGSSERSGIYLIKDDGEYIGRAFLKAGDCPLWQWAGIWGRPDRSQPTASANNVAVSLHRLQPHH